MVESLEETKQFFEEMTVEKFDEMKKNIYSRH